MRAFRNIPRKKQQSLQTIYPVLDPKATETLESWDYVAITVFDHWLTRDEFERFFTARSVQEQIAIDEKWRTFYRLLSRDISCYQARYRSSSRVVFKAPRNNEVFEKRLMCSLGEPFLIVVIPEIKAIFKQDYDDTGWLYFENRNTVKPFLDKIQALGMYSLERTDIT